MLLHPINMFVCFFDWWRWSSIFFVRDERNAEMLLNASCFSSYHGVIFLKPIRKRNLHQQLSGQPVFTIMRRSCQNCIELQELCPNNEGSSVKIVPDFFMCQVF